MLPKKGVVQVLILSHPKARKIVSLKFEIAIGNCEVTA